MTEWQRLGVILQWAFAAVVTGALLRVLVEWVLP